MFIDGNKKDVAAYEFTLYVLTCIEKFEDILIEHFPYDNDVYNVKILNEF